MIEHGRTDASVFVIDDSQDRASQSDGRAMLSTLKTSGGPELRFIGYEERHALVSKLHRKRAAPPEVLDFAFCPEKLLTTEGAARNCIMLLTSGMFILQTDDDTSCAYVSATNQDNTLRISALPDPNQTRFYADRRSNLDNSPLSRNLDPFAIHESILGQSLTNLVSARDNVSWQDIDSYALSCFITGPGRIDITVTGASGDPGTGSSMGFLTIAPDDTIEQIYSNPNTYRWATAGREVLKAVSNTTVSKGMYFQAMSFGINNSRLQPPFFPWGRNLDGAFAHLYLKSDPQAWIGHLPYSISHESEPGRGYTGTPASDASTVRLTDILQICMGQIKVTPDQSTGQALRSIAEQLISVGSMSPRLFSSYVRCVYIQSRFELLAFLDLRVARSFVKHQQWHDEIREMSKRIRQSMIEPDNIVPVDLRKTFGVDHSLEIARLSILRYGMLIKYWEDITSIASSSSQLS